MLYDLRGDPSERVNLAGSPYGDQTVGAYREALLKVLTDHRGSNEVEDAYLGTYRQGLETLVEPSSPARVAVGP
jgi:hypothetical protein